MSRTKGQPKTGGREKGTPNKVTTELKTWINDLLNANRAQIKKDLETIEPYQRIVIFEKLLAYTIPKMQNVNANIDLSKLSDELLDNVVREITNNIEEE